MTASTNDIIDCSKNKLVEVVKNENSLEGQNTVEANKNIKTMPEELLGELLRELREQQEVRLLVVCREIKSFSLNSNQIVIDANEEILKELIQDKSKKILNSFFEKRGLTYTLVRPDDKEKSIKQLKSILGDKLVIK